MIAFLSLYYLSIGGAPMHLMTVRSCLKLGFESRVDHQHMGFKQLQTTMKITDDFDVNDVSNYIILYPAAYSVMRYWQLWNNFWDLMPVCFVFVFVFG